LIRYDIDLPQANPIINIVDYSLNRSYTILNTFCYWNSIKNSQNPPYMYFPLSSFLGQQKCRSANGSNDGLCNEWHGCHPYDKPPAPYVLQASISSNIPVFLNFPSMFNLTIYLEDFETTAPPSIVFQIPANCTNMDLDSDYISFQQLLMNELRDDNSFESLINMLPSNSKYQQHEAKQICWIVQSNHSRFVAIKFHFLANSITGFHEVFHFAGKLRKNILLW